MEAYRTEKHDIFGFLYWPKGNQETFILSSVDIFQTLLLLQEGFYCTSYYCSYKQSNNRPCSFKPYCEKQPYRICSKLPQGLLYPHIHSFIASMCKTLFKGATPQPLHDQIKPSYM